MAGDFDKRRLVPQIHEFAAYRLGMRIGQLQELQKENARLKRLVADQALDNQILREAARPNW